MSPKKVDKRQKREEIALACKDLIFEVGMKKLTVSQVAQRAGIGKGTVYEYFENKGDVLFEIINVNIEYHQNEFLKTLQKAKSIREKIELFFKLLDSSREDKKHFNAHKEFLSMVLTEDNDYVKEVNYKRDIFVTNELRKILEEGVNKGQLQEEVLLLIDGIIVYQKGLMFKKLSQDNFDVKKDFQQFMDTIFNLVKK